MHCFFWKSFIYLFVIAAFFCAKSYAQEVVSEHRTTVQEIVRLCTQELEKVRDSANTEIPSGTLTPQTNVAHENIAWAVERFEKFCQSREYWKTELDNLLVGRASKNEDVELAKTVLGVVVSAHNDWEDVMNTFNNLVVSTREMVEMRKIEEMKRREEEHLRKLREEEDMEKEKEKEEVIRRKQEYIQKQLEKRQRYKELERMNRAAEENVPKTKTQKK